MDWLTAAFGCAERVRIGDSHRAQLSIGTDGAVIVADVRGEQRAPEPGSVTQVTKVRVDDVDAQFERAPSAGADPLRPTDRHYTLRRRARGEGRDSSQDWNAVSAPRSSASS